MYLIWPSCICIWSQNVYLDPTLYLVSNSVYKLTLVLSVWRVWRMTMSLFLQTMRQPGGGSCSKSQRKLLLNPTRNWRNRRHQNLKKQITVHTAKRIKQRLWRTQIYYHLQKMKNVMTEQDPFGCIYMYNNFVKFHVLQCIIKYLYLCINCKYNTFTFYAELHGVFQSYWLVTVSTLAQCNERWYCIYIIHVEVRPKYLNKPL